jgi:hypothetical protein
MLNKILWTVFIPNAYITVWIVMENSYNEMQI